MSQPVSTSRSKRAVPLSLRLSDEERARLERYGTQTMSWRRFQRDNVIETNRPPLDPTLMFRALFVGYLFGVRSEVARFVWYSSLKLRD